MVTCCFINWYPWVRSVDLKLDSFFIIHIFILLYFETWLSQKIKDNKRPWKGRKSILLTHSVVCLKNLYANSVPVGATKYLLSKTNSSIWKKTFYLHYVTVLYFFLEFMHEILNVTLDNLSHLHVSLVVFIYLAGDGLSKNDLQELATELFTGSFVWFKIVNSVVCKNLA